MRLRRKISRPLALCLLAVVLLTAGMAQAGERLFAGAVSSASPEATAAGVEILERGGNAIDAAVAVSLALGASEPAGSGIAGQTVMLLRPPGGDAFVINGTTWSPRTIPDQVSAEQLKYGHTAAAVPSTLRVLDLAWRRYGSGQLSWAALLGPAIRIAEDGWVVGPFRARAFRFYHESLLKQPAAAALFTHADGTPYQEGEVFRQPQLAQTLRRLAAAGAADFYSGAMAAEIVADMEANGGWITARDLAEFPEPALLPALAGSYRGHDVFTLPPPFGGWVVLQILNLLEQSDAEELGSDDTERRLLLLDALRIGHDSRRQRPVGDYVDYQDEVAVNISKAEAQRLLLEYRSGLGEAGPGEPGGETTHFSVVDGDGMAVAVTQSIDSYFGAGVAHPQLGFLYNNYMQGFRIDDPAAPYALEPLQMPKSSMSATIVSRGGRTELALGSPGSARIISAVAQTISYWVDVERDVSSAVAAFRVHVVPPDRAYVEGPELPPELLAGMARRGLTLARPTYGVSDSQLDPYFGGVHALAFEQGSWTGAPDPRRDGRVGFAWKVE
ncbi:gamma-glutamyltransferase family protein [Pseudomonadota bacterium]